MESLVPGEFTNTNNINIKIEKKSLITSFDTHIITFGSCFAQHIHNTFVKIGLNSFYCTHGNFHYTAKSLHALLKKWSQNNFVPKYTKDDFYLLNDGSGLYVSLYHYNLKDKNINELIQKAEIYDNKIIKNIQQANLIFLTLGNATYIQLNDGRLVNKVSGILKSEYTIKYSSTEEITIELMEIYTIMRLLNKNFTFFLTVSPQRYNWETALENKDTIYSESIGQQNTDHWIVKNNLDKAKLRIAIDTTIKKLKEHEIIYFPSYDIVIDELRQFETFSSDIDDLLHVNFPKTSNYVINKFLNTYCSEDVKKVLSFYRKEIIIKEKLKRKLEHFKNTFNISNDIKELISPISELLVKTKALHIINHLYRILSEYKQEKIVEKLLYNSNFKQISKNKEILINKVLKIIDSPNLYNKNKSIYIYGAGEIAKILLEKSKLLMPNIKGIIDSEPKKIGTYLYGVKIISPTDSVIHDSIIILTLLNDNRKVYSELVMTKNIEIINIL